VKSDNASDKIFDEMFGVPTPKQDELFMAKTRYVGYGGAKGGGKSWAIRAKSTALAIKYPGIKILVIRKKNKDLKRNYVRPLQTSYGKLPDDERPTFNVTDMLFSFPNTSIIEMGFCDSDADADEYRGNEWDILILDEATDLSEYQIKTLVTVVRGVNKFPKRIYITFNPGGVGHSEIKRIFTDKNYNKHERAKDYTFIPARIWHNTPFLMADHGFVTAWTDYRKAHHGAKLTEEIAEKLIYSSDYVRGLGNLPDVLVRAYIYGDMNVFFGQYFSEYNSDIHEIDPRDIPKHWKRTAAIDYGQDMFAALWFAADETGMVYCYRNFEQMKLTLSEAGKVFKDLSVYDDGTPENIEYFVVPHDMLWNSQDTGIPKIHSFRTYCNFPYVVSGKDRESSWLQCKEYLKYEAKKTPENEQIITVPPKMVFFNTCRWITKYIPQLQNDPKKPTDVMKEPHEITHSPDAWRGWCSVWQSGTVVEPPKPVYHFGVMKPQPSGTDAEPTMDYLVGGY
jgi:phage terminase large subunit